MRARSLAAPSLLAALALAACRSAPTAQVATMKPPDVSAVNAADPQFNLQAARPVTFDHARTYPTIRLPYENSDGARSSPVTLPTSVELATELRTLQRPAPPPYEELQRAIWPSKPPRPADNSPRLRWPPAATNWTDGPEGFIPLEQLLLTTTLPFDPEVRWRRVRSAPIDLGLADAGPADLY